MPIAYTGRSVCSQLVTLPTLRPAFLARIPQGFGHISGLGHLVVLKLHRQPVGHLSVSARALMPHSFGHTFGSGQYWMPGGHMHPVAQGATNRRACLPQSFWQTVGAGQDFIPSGQIHP